MTPSQVWLKISDAAVEAGVSRRTIERWIATGKLTTTPYPRDRRLKLVRLEDVISVAKSSPVRRRKRTAKSEPTTLDVYSEVIDETLRIVYAHHRRLITKLFPDAERPLNMDVLRSGPLGRDLSTLAALARGEIREPKELVLERIETVLKVFFWPPMADDYTIPRSFWETPIGRILSMAKYRAYEPSELITIREAVNRLDVNVATIYRWMDERHLGYVRDEMSGRTFVVKHDVDTLLDASAAIGPVAHPSRQSVANSDPLTTVRPR